ncbi:MAG: DUF4255 domain-containing protein [Methylococcaceae bacterium]|nr:DUF4255 domain-containing protein [Methylococcaceae bacterium]
MIGDVLEFIRDRLDEYLISLSTDTPGSVMERKVCFLELDQSTEHVNFKLNCISIVLLNIEEERIIRNPDPYRRGFGTGDVSGVTPEVNLNLHCLFVARFKDYKQGVQNLSHIIKYFQTHRYFDEIAAPQLAGIAHPFTIELISLTFSELNEIWGGFRSALLPCIAYRIRTFLILDDDSTQLDLRATSTIEIALGRQS